MAQRHKVVRSINAEGDTICVDIFRRNDGTFGFEEYRRDPEDGRGWFPIGHHDAAVFEAKEAALAAAIDAVGWLEAAANRPP